MICMSCGRPLKNPNSIKRGYGPGCYKKIKKEHEGNEQLVVEEQIEGQMDIEEVV